MKNKRRLDLLIILTFSHKNGVTNENLTRKTKTLEIVFVMIVAFCFGFLFYYRAARININYCFI